MAVKIKFDKMLIHIYLIIFFYFQWIQMAELRMTGCEPLISDKECFSNCAKALFS